MAIQQNLNPANIFNKSVTLSTLDQISNQYVAEGYIISSPKATGVVPIQIAQHKYIIPLTTAAGDGAPFLKLWYPTGRGITLFCTFCVQNQFMADNYYDYTTGVPAGYISSLLTWINTNPSTGNQLAIPLSQIVRSRTLFFSAYGNNTNDPQNAVTFSITFQGTFGNANIIISPPPNQNNQNQSQSF